MDNMDAVTFNTLFIEKLDTTEGMQKSASAGASFVRSKIREIGFSRKILPPESVTRADAQRSTTHDTLEMVVDIEHDSKAMVVNFLGEAEESYLQGNRYAIPFFKIESQKFIKEEAELLAYNYPITKVIEENSVKDIQAIEDSKFIEFAEIGCSHTGKRLASPEVSANRKSLNSLFKMIDYDKLTVGTVLMTVVDHDDFLIQPATEIGSGLASEITHGGYKYPTIMGRKLVITNKHEFVAPGEIWAFADAAYLGNFFILNDVKFWIKKEADLVMWKTWEYVAEGFGNIKGIAKLELQVPAIIPVGGTI